MEVTQERVKVKMLKAVLGKSQLGYAKDALDYINILEKQLAIYGVVKSLPQDNFCIVCNLPTDGIKCYSKRCPI